MNRHEVRIFIFKLLNLSRLQFCKTRIFIFKNCQPLPFLLPPLSQNHMFFSLKHHNIAVINIAKTGAKHQPINQYSHYTVTSQKFHSSNLSFLNTSIGILCLIFITIYNLKHFLSTSMKIRFYIRLFRYLDVSIPRHMIVRHDIYMSVYQSILVLFQHPFSE
jgi:hypothetical protein